MFLSLKHAGYNFILFFALFCFCFFSKIKKQISENKIHKYSILQYKTATIKLQLAYDPYKY